MTDAKLTAEQYSVGEVAIFHRPGSSFHGMEVTITKPLHLSNVLDWKDGSIADQWVYGIDGPFDVKPRHGTGFCAAPTELRKKRPPPDWVKLCRLDEMPAESEGVPA